MDEGYLRFRWHVFVRRLRRWWRRSTVWSRHFGKRYVARRTDHLRGVQRFILGWLAVFVIALLGVLFQLNQLDQYYLTAGGQAGGTMTEGVVGEIPLINPIYPENQAVRAASKLIFSGITRYNGQGKIEADLAESWQLDADGKNYNVKLRPGVFWHDGTPLTSRDVAFTFRTIQNPSANSPLNAAWEDVDITTPDDLTVIFSLPTPYAPFLDSLTTGILPAHLLQTAEPSQLRKVDFNQRPIGTGPFKFKDFSLARDEVRTLANDGYYGGRPQLEAFTLKTFATQEELLQAYNAHAITTAAGLEAADTIDIAGGGYQLLAIPSSNQAFAFFNNERPILKDQAVRQALTAATNPPGLVERLGLSASPARSALLPEHIGFNAKLVQQPPDLETAKAKLEKAGWKLGDDGWRHKKQQRLSFELVTQDSDIYPDVASQLQAQWLAAGVEVRVKLVSQQELQQVYLRGRDYDVLVAAISLGGDPDVYPFWHSSQIGANGLNLSQYTSRDSDRALESGRTRPDPELRQAKYESFLEIWRQDAPAAALFRLDYYYGSRDTVQGIKTNILVNPTDRYFNVQEWTIKPEPQLKRLVPNVF